MNDSLKTVATGLWWMFLLRGILAIIFGIIALLSPGIALVSIAIIVGVYLIVEGIAEIAQAVQNRRGKARWGWLLFQGIVSVLAGLAVLVFPGTAAVVGGLFVLWTIVFYAIVHGIAGLSSAAGASGGQAKTWGIVSGVATLLFGVVFAVLILVTPGATLISLIWVIAIYAIIFGIALIVAAFQLRRGISTILQGA